jgi:hypothetical protein
MRKRSDNAVRGKKEAEVIAAECMDAIAEISSGKLLVPSNCEKKTNLCFLPI